MTRVKSSKKKIKRKKDREVKKVKQLVKVSGKIEKKINKKNKKADKLSKAKNKKIDINLQKKYVKKLETEILLDVEITEIDIDADIDADVDVNVDEIIEEPIEVAKNCISEVHEETKVTKEITEQILFRLPIVSEPLIGTPKDVQNKLDKLAKCMQKNPEDNESFNRIHLYMHGYLINVVLKKFPYIRGSQTVDIYQETLIALRFKAIPGFKSNRGMSFLNFAKMCIRRHLITLLHTSQNRNKDKTINQAISLDSSPSGNEDDNSSYANIIADKKDTHDEVIQKTEAYQKTKKYLYNALSSFEQLVLEEYLTSSSYREISKNISKSLGRRYNVKSIDNALLRIRKKAFYLLKHGKKEELPLFLEQLQKKH